MSYYYNNRGGFLSNMPTAIRHIIIINILVMIMTSLNGDFMYEHFALFYPTSPFFHWWQPVTHMFMHGGFWHLFFNMYTLYIFGSVLERIWGTKKFLVFYFVTGLGAAAIHTGVEWMQMQHWLGEAAQGSMAAQTSIHMLKMTPTVGASGAIYGVLMGYAMLYPDSVLTLIFPPISMKAKWFVNRWWHSTLRSLGRSGLRFPSYMVLEEETNSLRSEFLNQHICRRTGSLDCHHEC